LNPIPWQQKRLVSQGEGGRSTGEQERDDQWPEVPEDALSQRENETTALRSAIEAWLPEHGEAAEPAWSILALHGVASAPVLSISRDPRSGPRLAPVFFIGVAHQDALAAIGRGLYEGTQHVAKLFHTVLVPPKGGFLVVPCLYHVDDLSRFSAATTQHLTSLEARRVAWLEERCEVLIVDEGTSYKAVLGAGDSLEVVARNAT
jgi:hypothetical protein